MDPKTSSGFWLGSPAGGGHVQTASDQKGRQRFEIPGIPKEHPKPITLNSFVFLFFPGNHRPFVPYSRDLHSNVVKNTRIFDCPAKA